MTVLLFDASAELHLRLPRSSSDIAVDELVYADDTMVVAVDASRAETYMTSPVQGWTMACVSIGTRSRHCLFAATFACSNPMVVRSTICQGSLLDGSGDIGSELNGRLGSARAAFKTLTQVWKLTRISRQHKVRIFEACVGSQLLNCCIQLS